MGARSKIIDLNRSSAEIDAIDDLGPTATSDGIEPSANDAGEADYQDWVHESQNQSWDEEEAVPGRDWGSIAAIGLLLIAFIGWTGFFAWAHSGELTRTIPPARIAELVIAWSVPTCLIALVWLLGMRLSSREAARFGDVARSLREESLALEERMRRVNGEIALARSFLAENARELETVGRTSAQRLTDAAGTLTSALAESDERAQMLQVASNAAVTNLEQLRNHLPVVTSAAKDATNQIGIAGNSAHGQIQAILATLGRVAEASASTGDDLGKLDVRLTQSAAALEQRISASAEKLASAVTQSRDTALPLFTELDQHIAAIESRISEASASARGQIDESDGRLTSLIADLQGNVDKLQASLSTHDATAQDSIIRLSGFIEETRNNVAAMDTDATDRIAKLAFAVSALVESNSELTGRLSRNSDLTNDFMMESTTLLDLLRQIEAEASGKLPEAISALQGRFEANRATMHEVVKTMEATDRKSVDISNRLSELEPLISRQDAQVAALWKNADTQVSEQHKQLEALSAALADARGQIDQLVALANDQLASSMQRAQESTREATEISRRIVEEELAEITGAMTDRNVSALRSAIEEQIRSVDIAMHESLQQNLGFANEIEERAKGQLQRLDEMTANLEQRIAQAHSSFAGIDDEGFARRMALLTESLNSAAIDVAKILSNEVTDTAWAAYLKGDRGVFTRRAVRLLDNTEAKIIAANYDEDAEFRDNVNRYIHDFEAMMRVLLSTRDGNAIGVTLLSSDVGKLYVALAQAIERLRS
jgi:hypothetical protein